MAPNSTIVENPISPKEHKKENYKIKIAWFNVFFILYLHTSFLYAIYLSFTSAYLKTVLFAYIYGYMGALGGAAGPHRLWSHRSYKAKWPLRVLLCCLFSILGQSDIYEWCRDHRVHHKFAETDADPYNIKRGFFFAHVGWLMCKKHPEVIEKGKTLLYDDLWADPIVRFHKRFYLPMSLFFSFFLPTMIPVWCWGETTWNSFFIAGVGRNCFFQNLIWLLNSVAHKYGNQPFTKHLEARQNAVLSFFTLGEGWHNYHHVFPWDYATGEIGYTLDFVKIFIHFMTSIGQAYDLKSVQPEIVKNRILKMEGQHKCEASR